MRDSEYGCESWKNVRRIIDVKFCQMLSVSVRVLTSQ